MGCEDDVVYGGATSSNAGTDTHEMRTTSFISCVSFFFNLFPPLNVMVWYVSNISNYLILQIRVYLDIVCFVKN